MNVTMPLILRSERKINWRHKPREVTGKHKAGLQAGRCLPRILCLLSSRGAWGALNTVFEGGWASIVFTLAVIAI